MVSGGVYKCEEACIVKNRVKGKRSKRKIVSEEYLKIPSRRKERNFENEVGGL